MDLHSVIQAVIASGVKAPSGDNLQRWRFEVTSNTISIYKKYRGVFDGPIESLSLASYITYGALIENMAVTADHLGYSVTTNLFPVKGNPDHLADVILEPDPTDYGLNLFTSVEKRATDRRPYQEIKIDDLVIKDLVSVPNSIGVNARVVVIEDRVSIKRLARLTTLQMIIMFSKKLFHQEFFDSLRWNKRTAIRTKDGLDAITLELDLLRQFLFRYVLGSWLVMMFFSKLGLARLVASLEVDRYKKAGAYVAVISRGKSKEDAVMAGRVFERVWLTLTKHGLSAQPTFAPILIKQVLDADGSLFTDDEADLIEQNASEYRYIFNLEKDENIMCIMRTGKTEGLPRRSFRKEPEILFKG